MERHARRARAGEKDSQAASGELERILHHLEAGHPVRTLDPPPADVVHVRELSLLTSKPVMYIANVDEMGEDNPHVATVRKIAERDDAEVVVISGLLEAEIAELEPEDRQAFLEEIGQDESGLDRVIRAGHRLLGLGTFFTGDEKSVRAWTFRHGIGAAQAAGLIHTDFETGFIRAEVVTYHDFVTHGGEQGAKDAGKWRLEGRDYVVQEGDVIHFRFNV